MLIAAQSKPGAKEKKSDLQLIRSSRIPQVADQRALGFNDLPRRRGGEEWVVGSCATVLSQYLY